MTEEEYNKAVTDEYETFLKLMGDDIDKERVFRFGFHHGYNVCKKENEKSSDVLRVSRQDIINMLAEAEKQSNMSVNKGLYSSGYWQAKKEMCKKLLGMDSYVCQYSKFKIGDKVWWFSKVYKVRYVFPDEKYLIGRSDLYGMYKVPEDELEFFFDSDTL